MDQKEFIQKEFIKQLKKKILSHSQSGKLSTYILSNGKIFQEMKSVYEEIEDTVFKEIIVSYRQ
tara:strand:- start:107 stop:298 length:192 start_codon:yes stop_codon:yes gene_type:complete